MWNPRRPMIELALFALLLLAAPVSAQPAHCERAHPESGAWPAIGEPAPGTDASPISPAQARRVVAAFRRHWASVPHPSAVLRAFTECMTASDEHFVVRRVTRDDAARTLGGPGERLDGGGAVPDVPWVWEVYWGGASRGFRPSGPVSLYLTPDLGTLVGALQHLEG